MKITAVTQRGEGKTHSEDRLLVGRRVIAERDICLVGKIPFCAVADGVGGMPHGEMASTFVLSALADAIAIDCRFFHDVNRRLLKEAAEKYGGAPMATTLTGFCFLGEETYLFHVGNTRAYSLKRKKYLYPLTEDDTTVSKLYRRGLVTKEEACHSPRKNEICACFGGGTETYLDIKLQKIMPEFPLILTSDGIHDHLTEEQLEAMLTAAASAREACDAILSAARSHGSRDDMSIAIVEEETQNT